MGPVRNCEIFSYAGTVSGEIEGGTMKNIYLYDIFNSSSSSAAFSAECEIGKSFLFNESKGEAKNGAIFGELTGGTVQGVYFKKHIQDNSTPKFADDKDF
jgi:hypothetical protein